MVSVFEVSDVGERFFNVFVVVLENDIYKDILLGSEKVVDGNIMLDYFL